MQRLLRGLLCAVALLIMPSTVHARGGTYHHAEPNFARFRATPKPTTPVPRHYRRRHQRLAPVRSKDHGSN
jgi:hypothetical protein